MWQSEFAAGLRDPEAPPPAAIQRHDGKPAPRRFGVYRNNVYSSLVTPCRWLSGGRNWSGLNFQGDGQPVRLGKPAAITGHGVLR